MKKQILLTLVFISLVFIGLAQVPEAFNYQAVVRNSSGEVVANQNVSFKISILQGSASGSVVYAETHTMATNAYGLVNLQIGDGTLLSGIFSPGGWGLASHFIKIEFDPAGGSTFTHLGTSELLSVPYAFHAKTVEDDAVDDADADPANELQIISLSGTDLTLSDGGGTVTLPSTGGGDNWGTQTVESDATLSGVGTSGDPLAVVGDLTDDQTLSLSGDELSISDGNAVTLPGDDWGTQTAASDATLSGVGTSGDPLSVVGDLTDDQTLSVSGNDLSISNGNTVILPSGLWEQDGSDVYYNDGKVGVGKIPGGDFRQFQVLTAGNQAIAGQNNSSYGTIFAQNLGSGPAGDFRNHIRIIDGTQGVGKILISDAGGNSSWEDPIWNTNGTSAYYNDGFVGIGTNNPARPLDINAGAGESYVGFHNNNTGSGFSNGLIVGASISGLGIIWNYENAAIRIGTNNLRRIEILGNGNVGIGTIEPTHLLSVNGTAGKVGGGLWSTFSDRRLKDLHGSYEKGLSEIVALQPVVFNYKADNPLDLPSDREEIGLIAQEVKEIFPEAVILSQNGYLDLNMHPINVAFVNAIKELKTENDNLKEKVNELESRLAEIEKMLQQ